jgi:hypothetical protein
VSAGSLVAEQEVDESPEQVQAKKTLVQVHFPSFNMHADCSILVPPMENLSRINSLLEESAVTTIHLKRDASSFIHY